jgi:signal transduction histidine kinase/CheY-like chemotaxis protein
MEMGFLGRSSSLRLLALAAAYYVSARLGLQLQFEQTQATPVWPPSGLAFAALLLLGPRFAGGVFLGAFFANLADFYVKSAAPLPPGLAGLLQHFAAHPGHVVLSALIGVGNMLEAVGGVYLLRALKVGPDVTESVRAVLAFIAATLLCCLLASVIGASSLFLGDALPRALLPTAAFTWWLGDATGILIVAPLVLTWSRLDRRWFSANTPAKIATMLLLLLFCELTFSNRLDVSLQQTPAHALTPVLLKTQAYALVPILLWIEFMFGNALGSLGIAIAATVAVLGTIGGNGPFIGGSQNESLLVLQGFVGVVSIAVLALDAALRERRQALAGLTRARDELERRVDERTAQLRQLNHELSRQVGERNHAVEALQRETVERHRVEEALRQSQKLEALGQLTGGVAHDFNNLLLIISNNLYLLRHALPGITARAEFVAIDRALARAEALTRQLLAFGRRQTLQARRIELVDHMPKVAELMRHMLRGDIQVRLEIAPDVAPVDIDANEFELAMINIAANAKDAMPRGGVLTIAIQNTLPGQSRHDVDEPLGEGVGIAISDTGVGIRASVLPRVFEPFFTTKEPGKGTGLGLSQVYGFARQSGGSVTVTSEEGKGTTVTLSLPRSSRPAAENKPMATPAELGPSSRYDAEVLVVEDNPEVAEVSVALLQSLGCAVTLTESARQALEVLASGKPFDLVFTDVVMPGGMSGVELARALRVRYPDLPVLLTTGYSVAALDAGKEGFPILPKPYRPAALQAQLGELLNPQRASRA